MLYLFSIDVNFDQAKLLLFYNVQTTNLTFVDKLWDIQYIDKGFCNPK